ncbi:hypothetical protein PR048_010591 [Dryococelus australis]|uniref:Uncharacterized protein n=1 Tax=Dryococelus australis TaxID=614101 RepID=A0ABQ9I3L7_9NEOP|nr:hypothetical protein PR048_010591 [Dryococelus australis]
MFVHWLLPHKEATPTWQYGTRYLFPSKSAIGSESSRACLTNCDPTAKSTRIAPDDAAGRRVLFGVLPFPSLFHSGALPSITNIGSQDLALKSRLYLLIRSLHRNETTWRRSYIPEVELQQGFRKVVDNHNWIIPGTDWRTDFSNVLLTSDAILWAYVAAVSGASVCFTHRLNIRQIDLAGCAQPISHVPTLNCFSTITREESGTDWEGIGHGLWFGTHPAAFAWSDFGKPWKAEIRIVGPGIEPGSSIMRVHGGSQGVNIINILSPHVEELSDYGGLESVIVTRPTIPTPSATPAIVTSAEQEFTVKRIVDVLDLDNIELTEAVASVQYIRNPQRFIAYRIRNGFFSYLCFEHATKKLKPSTDITEASEFPELIETTCELYVEEKKQVHNSLTDNSQQHRYDIYAVFSFRSANGLLRISTCSGAAVAERLACSSLTKAIRVQSPGRVTPGGFSRVEIVPDDACWSVGFLGDLPSPQPMHSGASPFSTHFNLVGFQDNVVKGSPNLSTQLISMRSLKYKNEYFANSFRDKIDGKRVYSEVTFAIGSQFIRPALHASEPIADLQRNTCEYHNCQVRGNSQ